MQWILAVFTSFKPREVLLTPLLLSDAFHSSIGPKLAENTGEFLSFPLSPTVQC